MRSSAKTGIYLSVGLISVGFLLIFFAWNGAAEVDFVQGQFPYLLSGGLTGLGFILCGLALAITQSFRADILRLQDRLEEALQQAPSAGAGPRAAGVPTLTAVPEADVFVTTGSTYHLSSCRTVRGRAGLDLVSPEDVESRELAACRVCRPAA